MYELPQQYSRGAFEPGRLPNNFANPCCIINPQPSYSGCCASVLMANGTAHFLIRPMTGLSFSLYLFVENKVDRFRNVLYQIRIFGLAHIGSWRPIHALNGSEQAPRIDGDNLEDEIIGLARRFTGYQDDVELPI